MIYLVDANVLVHLANRVSGSERILARYDAQPRGRVRLSAATAHELRFMILMAKASAKHVASLDSIARAYPVEPFELAAAARRGRRAVSARNRRQTAGHLRHAARGSCAVLGRHGGQR